MRESNIRNLVAGLVLAAGVLGGCEGITTGTEVANAPLQAAESGDKGAYAPVKFTLSADMNPLAFNLRADFSLDATEFGKSNSYRAVLTQNGATVASRNINVNHPQSSPQGEAPPPSASVHTLFYVDVPGSGEYELTITPTKPVVITLKEPRVDVRRNVQRPPK